MWPGKWTGGQAGGRAGGAVPWQGGLWECPVLLAHTQGLALPLAQARDLPLGAYLPPPKWPLSKVKLADSLPGGVGGPVLAWDGGQGEMRPGTSVGAPAPGAGGGGFSHGDSPLCCSPLAIAHPGGPPEPLWGPGTLAWPALAAPGHKNPHFGDTDGIPLPPRAPARGQFRILRRREPAWAGGRGGLRGWQGQASGDSFGDPGAELLLRGPRLARNGLNKGRAQGTLGVPVTSRGSPRSPSTEPEPCTPRPQPLAPGAPGSALPSPGSSLHPAFSLRTFPALCGVGQGLRVSECGGPGGRGIVE